MDRWIDHAEQDGGGRVDVSMSRMTVARGSVSMSRIVHLLVCGLCGREVRLQSEAESAPQARNFQRNQCRLRAENGP